MSTGNKHGTHFYSRGVEILHYLLIYVLAFLIMMSLLYNKGSNSAVSDRQTDSPALCDRNHTDNVSY